MSADPKEPDPAFTRPVPADLKECRKLKMLMDRWLEVDERGAWESEESDRLTKLRDRLVAEYLPLVTALAQAGLLSFLFRVRGGGDDMLHHLQFACETAWVNGSIVLDGAETEGGSSPAVELFDALLAELPPPVPGHGAR